MANEADVAYMQRALDLARKARFTVAPNPMVGAVIVKRGQIIGEGYHRKAGTAHAEVVALNSARESVRGATMYVTLEPCCHTGRTGPCCEALIDAGIKRVVYAVTDTDPRVLGRGGRRLRRAGLAVEVGLLRNEALRLNEIYFAYQHLHRPFVILKTAQTLDGRIATRTGDSKWITGPDARRLVHEMRAEADGLIVGAETVRRDNPSLTVRHIKGPNPYRIIVTSSMRLPRRNTLLDQNDDFKTVIATTAANVEKYSRLLKDRRLIYWTVKQTRSGMLDIADLVHQAEQFGLRSLLVEGGRRVATSFLEARLIDKYVAFVAPMITGEGIQTIGDLRTRAIAESVVLVNASVSTVGRDFVITGYPEWRD